LTSFLTVILLGSCYERPQYLYIFPRGPVDIFLDVELTQWAGQLTRPACFEYVAIDKGDFVFKINYMAKDVYLQSGDFEIRRGPRSGCRSLGR